MPDIKQGEIYMVDIPIAHTVGSEQWKRRPYVIMSRLAVNKAGRNVVGVPLTHATDKACAHRMLLPAREIIRAAGCNFTFVDSVALTDQLRVLDVNRLEMPSLGCLSKTAVYGLTACLAFLLDIR